MSHITDRDVAEFLQKLAYEDSDKKFNETPFEYRTRRLGDAAVDVAAKYGHEHDITMTKLRDRDMERSNRILDKAKLNVYTKEI